jgi:hypothetical protein
MDERNKQAGMQKLPMADFREGKLCMGGWPRDRTIAKFGSVEKIQRQGAHRLLITMLIVEALPGSGVVFKFKRISAS